jgi:hypothetical protein
MEVLSNVIMQEKLEGFLDSACEAEARKDFAEAEHQFRLALFCDGRIRPDVTDAKEYVRQAGSVYKQAPADVSPEIGGTLS